MFREGLTRRLERDHDRLHSYFCSLVCHVQQQRSTPEVCALKVAGIEQEYRAKSDDLRGKYHLNYTVTLLQIARTLLPVIRVPVTIFRRKQSRQIFLDWNPLLRRFDEVTCEQCGVRAPSYSVQDESCMVRCVSCETRQKSGQKSS